jgi:hypothetical protein
MNDTKKEKPPLDRYAKAMIIAGGMCIASLSYSMYHSLNLPSYDTPIIVQNSNALWAKQRIEENTKYINYFPNKSENIQIQQLNNKVDSLNDIITYEFQKNYENIKQYSDSLSNLSELKELEIIDKYHRDRAIGGTFFALIDTIAILGLSLYRGKKINKYFI